jgi:lysozyme
MTKDMKISDNGIKCLTHDEGLRTSPYLDGGGVPTIGYGSTYYENGVRVTMKDPPITQERAYELMRNVVKNFEKGVNDLVTIELSQNHFDALVCLTYNIGLKAFGTSTMLKLLNKGDLAGAAAEFPKWNKDNGKVIKGLTNRRLREQALFLTTMVQIPLKMD